MESEYKELDYSKVLEEVKSVILEAGKIIKTSLENREEISSSIEVKDNNSSNVVTIVDKNVEQFLNSQLKTHFPSFLFIGEESTSSQVSQKINLTNAPTWVIDPLDGTTNFVHGIPFICISISLVVNKIPVIGVIYNPVTSDLYWAQKGKGSFLNGKKLPLLNKKEKLSSLEKCLILTEYGYHREEETVDKILGTIKNLLNNKVHGVRSFGSCALNMCFVAQGCADIYYEKGIHAWDYAAAALIIKEAGGVCVNWRREESLSQEIKIKDEGLNLISRNVVCIRHFDGEEGEEIQEKLINEMRKLIVDFDIECD